jgi:hypothetical protein
LLYVSGAKRCASYKDLESKKGKCAPAEAMKDFEVFTSGSRSI